MARLDFSAKTQFLDRLQSSSSNWVLAGMGGATRASAERLEGEVGLLDWLVHGQVSRLVKAGVWREEEFCLVPGDPALGRPSVLVYQYGETLAVPKLMERLRKLGVKELALVDATFPEDISRKLKQTLSKEGIGCTELGPLG